MTESDQEQLGDTLSGIASQSDGARFDPRQFFGAAHDSRQAVDDYLASVREEWDLMNDRMDTD